jgi:hypothetical protein
MVRNKKASSIKIKFNRTGRTYIYKEEENLIKRPSLLIVAKTIYRAGITNQRGKIFIG